jgi:uncharacterized protein (DUF1697 family)
MERYAAFLRGMNVGGHRITNVELRTICADIGLVDPECFRASGNIVFAAGPRDPAEFGAHIKQGLSSHLGYPVPVFVRTREQVLAIAARRPFPQESLQASAGKPQVALLSDAPSAAARRRIARMAGDRDEVAFGPLELHWLPGAGVLDSTLDMAMIESILGPMTMRTAGTVQALAAKHLAA